MRALITRESTGGSLSNARLMRGDTENIVIRISGQNLLVANFGFKFTCKVNATDTDGDAIIQKTQSSGITVNQISDTLIEAVIAIASSDTEALLHGDKLYYDIQMTTVTPVSVRTLQKSFFTIEADITTDNS